MRASQFASPMSLEAAVEYRMIMEVRWQREMVVTNGCFDLLHRGHIAGLEQARELGVALFVLMNSDASVRLLKGNDRPIVPETDRAAMVAALRCVDGVVLFDGEHCGRELAALHPNVYAKSAEYEGSQHPAEAKALEIVGATTVWLQRRGDWSTTNVIGRILEAARTPDHFEVPKTDPNWGLA